MKNISSSIKLIEAVKKHPILFVNSIHIEDEEHLKEWSAVAEACKLTRSQAQDQWNLLLLEYVDYLRSNQDFPLAKHMAFLQPHFFTVIDNEIIDEDELLNVLNSNDLDLTNTPKIENKDQEQQSPVVCETIKTAKFSKTNITENPSNTTVSPLQETAQVSLPTVVNAEKNIATQNNSSIGNLSSLELIFLGYAKQLQNMPLPLQLKTKRKISDLMDEAELEMMN